MYDKGAKQNNKLNLKFTLLNFFIAAITCFNYIFRTMHFFPNVWKYNENEMNFLLIILIYFFAFLS